MQLQFFSLWSWWTFKNAPPFINASTILSLVEGAKNYGDVFLVSEATEKLIFINYGKKNIEALMRQPHKAQAYDFYMV